ncbi:MAG: glycosyltransferase [Deltaproteobacteria bacterium]|nr:glycosyltransferase [Deltaproteobacteria bacterium]MBW1929223.1 glycosyltransferase [Deltaproteobacteria bacterium]MBW2025244.1 glycosyltransferase [Deltaproteobacteria bacterium]
MSTRNKRPPKISVVIFSYNFEKFIAEALESVINQTLQPYEVIVADDHSTDSSWKIISEYAEKYPKLIKAFRHRRNIGHIKNGKFGKDRATGDLLTVMDGDDLWLPEKLELEWKALQNYQGAKVAYSNVILIDEHGRQIGIWYDGNGPEPPSGDVFGQVFAKRFFPKTRSVFRNQLMYRDAILEVGYGDEAISVHADWDLKIRLAAKYPIVYSGAATVAYRVHEHGIHRAKAAKIYESAQAVIRKNIHLIESRSDEEKQFILDNLKSLLHQEYEYSRRAWDQNVTPEQHQREKASYQGDNLLFLVSQPRAGSTLLQRVLGSHSQIHTLAEPWVMLHPIYAAKTRGIETEYGAIYARHALEDFISELPAGYEDYYDGLREMARIWYGRHLDKSGKCYFLDKTPRYYFIIPELIQLFPNAKIIVLLRNPLSVLMSILDTWVQDDWRRLALHRHDLLTAPFKLVQTIRELRNRVLVLHYEQFVTQPEQSIRRLCDQLKLPYEHVMRYYGIFRPPKGRMGDNIGIEKYMEPSTDSLEKWKKSIRTPEKKMLAQLYLTLIGENIVTSMGYDFKALSEEVFAINVGPEYVPRETIKQILSALNLNKEHLERVEQLAFHYRNKRENVEFRPPMTARKMENIKEDLAESKDNEDTSKDCVSGNPNTELKKDVEAGSLCPVHKHYYDLRGDLDKDYVVSAIVSAYNSERFLRGCLEDLEAQTIRDRLEIIVVDSGSEQNEAQIVREFQKQYDNIVYIRTDQREGVYAAWNRGIKAARGKYITNANTDDRHRSNAFEKMALILDQRPDIALVYANVWITETENETFENHTRVGIYRWADYDPLYLTYGCFIGPQPMWRKSLHEKYGYFDESFESAGDWEFWLRISETEKFFHIDEVLGLYLKSPSSVEHRDPMLSRNEAMRVYKIYSPRRIRLEKEISEKLKHVEKLANSGKIDKAEEILKQLISIFPYHPKIRNDFAYLLWQRGRGEEALEHFRFAINRAPDDADIVWNCGQVLLEYGYLEDAMALYEAFLNKHPENNDIQEILSRLKSSSKTAEEAVNASYSR